MLSAKIMDSLVPFFWKASNKQFQFSGIAFEASAASPTYYSDVCITVKARVCSGLENFTSEISYWHKKLKSQRDM